MVVNDKSDNKLIFLMCAIIFGLFLTNLSSGINGFSFVPNVCKYVIFILLIWCIPDIIKNINLRMILYIFVGALLCLCQYMFFPDSNKYFVSSLITHITTIAPAIVCMLSIKNYDNLLAKLINTSFVISIINLIVLLLFRNNLFTNGYSMGFANIMIFPINVLIYYYYHVHKKRIYNIICMFFIMLNIIVVFGFGSRGALINVFGFWVYQILSSEKRTFRKYITTFLSVLVIVVFALAYKDILAFLISIFNKIGISSRTLYLFMNEMTHDSGRIQLWNIIIERIKMAPFDIRGINADYLLVGIYSHNFILELFYSFGLFFGGIIVGYIIYSLFSTVFAKDSPYIIVRKIFMFSFFPLMLWSGSIWTNMFFWCWILLFKEKHIGGDKYAV